MSDANTEAELMFSTEIVYQVPYAGTIKQNIPFGPYPRLMDIYYPENCKAATPAVIFVSGYRGSGFEKMTGRKLKEIAQNTSWARLIAATGLIAVHYCAEEPLADVQLLIDFMSTQGDALKIDSESLALWSCSGNVPSALNSLRSAAQIRCAVLNYGFMLDLHDSTAVADAAGQFGFAIPAKDKSSFPEAVPLLVIRAGRDRFPGVNESIDAFIAEGLKRNCNVSLINHAEGQHAFDIFDDTAESKRIIKASLAFLQHHLRLDCRSQVDDRRFRC